MTKFCNNCGNELDDDASFCVNCGAEIGTVISDSEKSGIFDKIKEDINRDNTINSIKEEITNDRLFNKMKGNRDKKKAKKTLNSITSGTKLKSQGLNPIEGINIKKQLRKEIEEGKLQSEDVELRLNELIFIYKNKKENNENVKSENSFTPNVNINPDDTKGKAEKLREFKKLLDDGIIDEEEFKGYKEKIINE